MKTVFVTHLVKNGEMILRVNFLTLLLISGARPLSAASEITDRNYNKTESQFKWSENFHKMGIKPHKTVNFDKFRKQYGKNEKLWNKVFDFFVENDLVKMETGRYAIDGDKCFALVSEYPTKEIRSAKIEAHQQYIDLHYVITGREKIGLVPSQYLQVKVPYDAERDVAIYSSPYIKYFSTSQNRFFLFFPGEAHCPGVKLKEVKTVKKLVIKILYEE